MDLVFVKSHNSGSDLDGTLVTHEPKGPGEHMRAVWVQGDRAARYVDSFH
jgi:hypothetical protein